jgi:amino acid transporter/nucleotide-binding universal stress UspA family protein
MATSEGSASSASGIARRLVRPAQVIIVGSVMFTFISYWRTAAVVLCDLASTAYYIGGIVEQAIGPAAPWFILAVMLFSYAVRSVYIESCSLFVRGGVYRVVKEAMGGFLAKLSVSALMFDYILTGPTSGVSAGQYIMGLALETVKLLKPDLYVQLGFANDETRKFFLRWGSVLFACAITLYFFRQNILGIHESSSRALQIMVATTIMAVVMLAWCGVTLIVRGPVNSVPWQPDLKPKVEYQLAARARLTDKSLDALAREGVPAEVRAKAQPLKDQMFNTGPDLKARLEAGLLSPQEVEQYGDKIVSQARIVERYELSGSTLEVLKAENTLPADVVAKLEPIKDKPFPSEAGFEHRLAELLTAKELAQYKPDIVDAAEVVEGIDRVTGEQRSMWARDPRTGQPISDTDKEGCPKPKKNEATGKQEDPLGFIPWLFPGLAEKLRSPGNWLSLIGIIGLFLAFGHSILAMSGEETLAQVYREVESPKLPNFKKAAFIVFVYSLLLTAGISFLAVLLIPNEVRMKDYSDNLIGGLAMYVIGPPLARLLLNAFVVVVGFLILAGAVNTAIIGSNGVLNRVAEDGVLPDWFLKPHPRYGTTYRLLYLIVALQLFTIIASRGNMYVLGEAYAFGVVWSFVFKALAMVVLRFKDRSPREFKVPLNVHVGTVEVPIGLSIIFVILLITAVLNFLTKEVATVGGVAFTVVFLTTFMASEHYHERRRRGKHEHLEQFNRQTTGEISPAALGLKRPYRKVVAIRSPQNLYMLEKTLAETDPDTTDVVIMTAKVVPTGDGNPTLTTLDDYDQHLMTAVVTRAEKAGKQVKPLIVPTNNPLHAVLGTAKDLKAQELVVGASNKYTADEQLEQMAFYWINLHDGQPAPLTIRILGRDRDVHLDLAGGNRIPRISERKARSVAELRAAGVGVDRVLLTHDGSPENSDLFQTVLTALDPQVVLALAQLAPPGHSPPANGFGTVPQDVEQARRLGREISIHPVSDGDPTSELIRLAREGQYDLIIVCLPRDAVSGHTTTPDTQVLLRQSPCPVFLAALASIPQDVAE